MTAAERNKLLEQLSELMPRIDERTLNLWHVLEGTEDSIHGDIKAIRAHQEIQNGQLLALAVRSSSNRTWLKIISSAGSVLLSGLLAYLLLV